MTPEENSTQNDLYESFVKLFVAHEGRLRGFLRGMLSDWNDIDEVMQETSLIAWRKFAQFEPGSNFMAWTAAIARFEALKHMRKMARDRLVFTDELLDLLVEDSSEQEDSLARHRSALTCCLDKLDNRQRQLLHLAYQPGMKFHQVAEQSGKSTQAFYKAIQRLRATLLECAEKQMKKEAMS